MNEYGYKIILIGDSHVGKSSLVNWLLYGKPSDRISPTIGASFTFKEIVTNGKNVKLNIWDTAGQERFRSIVRIYYKNTSACICVFDLGDRGSFNNVKYWLDDYQTINDGDNKIVIVANKCDLDKSKWKTTDEEIACLAREYDCEYIYTSCVTGQNVSDVFTKIANKIVTSQTLELPVETHTQKGFINLHTKLFPMAMPKCSCW